QFSIHRDQPILSPKLHSMAGKVKNGYFRILRSSRERQQRPSHIVETSIAKALYGEAKTLESGRHIVGVVCRVGERRNVPVSAVADHEGNACLARSRIWQPNHDQHGDEPSQCAAVSDIHIAPSPTDPKLACSAPPRGLESAVAPRPKG